MTPTDISKAGLNFIKREEGLVLTAYLDAVRVPTIGYGHTAGVTLGHVDTGRRITRAQAGSYLQADVMDSVILVRKTVNVELNQNQLDALVSFVFNIGGSNFIKSTLLRRLNGGDYDAVPFELSRWKFGTINGRKVPLDGLVSRRAREGALFVKPMASQGLPKRNQTTSDISPTPIREERSQLRHSRTMWGGATSLAGTATSAVSGVTSSIDPLTEKVSWLPDVLAGLILVGVVLAFVGAGVCLCARRDDFLKANR